MHTIEIPEKGLQHSFPSQIEEMNEHQFIRFIELVLQYTGEAITLEQFKASLIISLLDVRLDFMYTFMSADARENALAEIYRLGELCESFFEEIDHEGKKSKCFKLNFTRNFIPVICGIYHGPADVLQDVTFCEYRHAHRYYTAYLESHDENDLNHLIAVLYRPAKKGLTFRRFFAGFDGQIRVPFTSRYNPMILENRVKDIAGLPMAIRYGIFLFFSGCERFLVNGSVKIDGKTIEFSSIYDQRDGESSGPDIGLIGILYSLAETHVFGSIEETDNQNLYDIMLRLYQLVSQSKAMEQKLASYDTR